MLTKKSKAVSVPTPEISVTAEVTKPRARAKSSTPQIKTEKPVKAVAAARHTRVSSRKPVKSVEPMSQSITTADVATRAYHIWLERGCPAGTELENWSRAEHELRSIAVGQ